MAKKNLMRVQGKDVNKPNAYLTIQLADTKSEVRGFGQPVTRRKTKEMAEAYFTACEDAWKLVQEIESNKAYAALKKLPGFKAMRSLVNPSQHVSGVFGKEIILQILSLRHCEGIRYIHGRDGEANTLILAGVNEVGTTIKEDGTVKAQSALVARSVMAPDAAAAVATDNTDDGGTVFDSEVHDEGTTIEETRALLG
ncbi:hypothetical protein [Flavisolibacter ginsenosidimutans]|uniref:Uncharacterized protein n=1 Tax=Flavisolibacter ginsenosidimutans TaxID=661481 RepID=A0A5B8UKI0_9BACT|nr:hypothetical protein [Flavisolibacter ginsenosidimutans]QEC57063.1 hypothetical protein FSB75_14510 [Flavisolibacter ginsenosidimutans]